MNDMLLHQTPYDDTEDKRRLIKSLEDKIADAYAVVFRLSKLIYQLYDGLDDYWAAEPHNAEVVRQAKIIIGALSDNAKKELDEERDKRAAE